MPTHIPTLYAQQISSLYHGHALWDPHPGFDIGEDGRLTRLLPHVRPGDVGCLEEDGTFTRFFNIHLASDDSSQGRGPFPEGFQPIPKDRNSSDWRPVTHSVYRSHKWLSIFGRIGTVAPVPVNGGMQFSFEHNTGALLGFFDTGSREDSRMYRDYKEQIIENGNAWLQAARKVKPDCRQEDLILVTGCTCVRSWVTGVVENESVDGELSLSVSFAPDNSLGLQISSGVHCVNSGGSIIHYGPAERLKLHADPFSTHESQSLDRNVGQNAITSPLSPESQAASVQPLSNANSIKEWSDQCIFMRGFRMKRRLGDVLPKKLRAGAGPSEFSKKDREPGEGISLGSSLIQAEDDEDLQNDKDTWDHMHAALDYILENSDASIALVHEDDLLAYANFLTRDAQHQDEIIAEINADWVLKNCQPEVSVQDHSGVKETVGIYSEMKNPDTLTYMANLAAMVYPTKLEEEALDSQNGSEEESNSQTDIGTLISKVSTYTLRDSEVETNSDTGTLIDKATIFSFGGTTAKNPSSTNLAQGKWEKSKVPKMEHHPTTPRTSSLGSVSARPALKQNFAWRGGESASRSRYHVSLDMHPLLAASRFSRAPILYDVSRPPSSHTVIVDQRSAVPAHTLSQPATDPPVSRLILLSQKFPWPVIVNAGCSTSSSKDTVPNSSSNVTPILPHSIAVSCSDVLHAIHNTLSQAVTREEWEALGNGSRAQRKVTQAYESRCRLAGGGWERGVRRVDWLGEKTHLIGVEIDKKSSNGHLVFGKSR